MADGYAGWFNSPVDGNGNVVPATAITYPAAAERQLELPALMPGASALLARSGKRPGPGLEVTILTGPDRAQVAPGVGIISNDSGSYPFVIPAAVAKPIAVRPASGTSRIDLVVVRLYDQDVDSSGKREVGIEILPGQAAASPVAPQLPSGTLLARPLNVPSDTNAAITVGAAVTPRTVAAGGILPVASQAARDALPSPYLGQHVYREDTESVDIYRSTGWDDGTWTTFPLDTPNIALGNAPVFSGRYRRIGKTVHFNMRIVFGTTTQMLGDPRVYLPFPPASNMIPVFRATLRDASGGSVFSAICFLNEGTSYLRIYAIGSSYANTVFISPTLPFTWAVNDEIWVSGTYEVA